MTQEHKELLLKDLCARLPYGIKCKTLTQDINGNDIVYEDKEELTIYRVRRLGNEYMTVIPYIFPMSSMTEEQKQEFIKISGCETQLNEHYGFNSCGNYVVTIGDYEYNYDDGINIDNFYPNFEVFDWLNKHHFDYRGLIEKGLAINATGLNIY